MRNSAERLDMSPRVTPKRPAIDAVPCAAGLGWTTFDLDAGAWDRLGSADTGALEVELADGAAAVVQIGRVRRVMPPGEYAMPMVWLTLLADLRGTVRLRRAP
jgi:hypothetical protein